EGNGGTNSFSIPVRFFSTNREPVTIDYAIVDGTATAPDDYAAQTGTLNIPASTYPENVDTEIVVPIVADDVYEPNETFKVKITGTTNVDEVMLSEATTTILTDDYPSDLAVDTAADTVD